ncbi:hypothetical protein COTS27_00157 [Spirochaetota bacterium]|nr:hypothetical protein COTS27_00157 [Spirochaetota bacterium]
MMSLRAFIQFIVYTLTPVLVCVRGFYLYESIPRQDFRTYAFNIGESAWIIFLILVFIRVINDLLVTTTLLGNLLEKILSYERELLVFFTWLIFFHVLFIALTIKNFAAAFDSITNLQSAWSWGFLASLTAFFIGITSNNFSQRLLKTYWERTRFLFYGTFIFGVIHMAIIKNSYTYFLIVVGMFIVLKASALWRTFRS